MLSFEVVTLFPELFEEHIKYLPFKKALENGLLGVSFHNIRDHAVDKRGSVDDKPYGGGPGMIIRPEPIFDTVEQIYRKKNSKVVLLSPSGKKFTQVKAKDYSKLEQLILISGRYEGIDTRVEEGLADEVISIGDYVLSGGELPALVVMEAVTRILPGVLEDEAVKTESFEDDFIEYPQYTRPEEYKGMKVPDVLLSGDHKEIKNWREKNKKALNKL